jgi:general secretion pathway protein D
MSIAVEPNPRSRCTSLGARLLLCWLAISLAAPVYVPAQVPGAPPAVPNPGLPGTEKLILLNFRDAPLDQVLEFTADLLGRTLIKSPGLNATITLKSQTRLTIPEAMQAIDTVLAMNNVSLVPMGDKFLKVVQTPNARQEGMPIQLDLPETPFVEADQLVSQVIVLKHVEIAEITPIIQSLLHGYGKIQPLERNNSLLVTDTAANLRRVLEILEYVDQPVDAKVETRIYEIRFAKASEIASRLNELIAESQAKEDKPRVESNQSNVPPAIQALRPGGGSRGTEAVESAAALAERGVIRGKVKIIADERTNILFIISRLENFVFFDRIVNVLDRTVDPEIAVRVVALEYAKAEEISSILNEFVGAASQEKGTGAPATATANAGGDAAAAAADSRSQALREFIAQRTEQRNAAGAASEKSTFGRLSSDTKILADKRTNSLLLMGRKSDLDALIEVIDGLDIMLAQVLIETVIMEINLGKGIESGVDWLQRSVTAYQQETKGPRGGLTVNTPIASFGGGSAMNGEPSFRSGNSILTPSEGNAALGSGALSYYLTFFDLNLDAVIRLAANSRDARVLSTPVVLTTDNTEAKINIGEERPVVTSSSTTDTGTQTQNFEYRNIGIDLTVTPRINPQRYVVMEIAQKADNVGGFEVINGNNVPIITKREINAQIAVNSRNTIVLGGLVSTDKTKSRTKIPLLGDIPLLGAFFRSDSRSEARTELLVLITPYVLMTPDEARQETVRLHKHSLSSTTKWPVGWSDSELGTMSRKEMEEILQQRQVVNTAPLVRDITPFRRGETNAPAGEVSEPADESAEAVEPMQIETIVIPEDGEIAPQPAATKTEPAEPVEVEPTAEAVPPPPAAVPEAASVSLPAVTLGATPLADQPVPR